MSLEQGIPGTRADRLLLLKYGEIGLKGKNRPHFERILARNAGRALGRALGRGASMNIGSLQGRLVASLPAGLSDVEVARLAGAAARVFGLVAVAPARRVALDLQSLTLAAIEVAREASAEGARTFKLEVRRPNKTFPLTSPEVAAAAGRSVLESVPGLAVDVHEPEVRVGVEIRDDAVYVYGREVAGPGGLPLGTSGRALALISGGIDSPVAIWMSMKRGLDIIPLHFWSFPFTGERARQKVSDLCAQLGNWGLERELEVCPFTDIQTAIRDRCPEALRVTLMRRMMMRVATALARSRGALAIVTGESLGQVASQTIESLATIEAAAGLPVLRPLIALDKEEIISRARAIGTFELSILPYEDCCTLFVPARPRIKPTIEEAEAAEQALDVATLVENALTGTRPVRGS